MVDVAAAPVAARGLLALMWFVSGACASDATHVETEVAPDAMVTDETEDEIAPEPAEVTEEIEPDTVIQPPCQPGLAPGSDGTRRRTPAADFTVSLADGRTLHFAESFNGCESWLFIADGIARSGLDRRSIWESDEDVFALLDGSPDDVHYVFVSVAADPEVATSRLLEMQARLEAAVAALHPAAREHWERHLHVVAEPAQQLEAWFGAAILGPLAPGFVIGHDQRIRGLGDLSDVTRGDPALDQAGYWPWAKNLAYARYEAWYERAEAARRRELAAEDAVVVEVFSGQVLSELEDVEVELPDRDAIASFDTLTVEIELRCPDPEEPELASCGAWDYLASLTLFDVDHIDGGAAELARFITPYHREAHWVADISFALAWLEDGGRRRLRWSFAPSWNPQPTATWLSLRLSNRQKAARPASARLLFTGGEFGASYNDREPVQAYIDPGTTRAEVWSLVTGHGDGDNNCAEFCAHTHRISVGGVDHFKGFTEAGDPEGCIRRIDSGMTPNQGGTWWLGRGGWCPGAPVEPWVIDVTGEVTPGATATFRYEGLLGGGTPPDGSGNIVLTSYLVQYE